MNANIPSTIKKYVAPNIPYLFFMWAFLKLGTAFRLAGGANIGKRLINTLQHIAPAFASFAPSLYLFDWTVGLVGAVLMRVYIHGRAKQARKFRRDMEYGTARWGDSKDIAPFVNPKFSENVILTGSEFLTMNTRPANSANARNLNCCIIGGSGSGKTRFWLTPNLLQGHSSFVVVDPKGQILGQVGTFLRRQGYKVKVFNSIDFNLSQHYNPIAYLKTESDILKFVNALIQNTQGDGKESDPFWTKAETLLYCALIGYIVFEAPAEERHLATLVDMINSMETKESDENFKNPVDYMFLGLGKRKPDHFAVRQYKKFKLASGSKTTKSILISCGARLAPFDIEQLRGIMTYDELELDLMGDRKTATFFIISDVDTTYNFLVALAFSQMFTLLCERADNKHGGRLPHHVRILWDEAANTGQVPQLEKLVAVIRSREISLCLFLQAQSQLKAIYKDHAETIMGNMDSVVFLGGREHSTIKELSEVLGKETISMQTESKTQGQSPSHGQNMQRLGKNLMDMDELITMSGNKCILQLRGLRPFLSPKYDLRKHPNFKHTAEADRRNAFNAARLVNRRMKLQPNEQYTLYEVDVTEEDATIDEEYEDILNYDDVDDPEAFA